MEVKLEYSRVIEQEPKKSPHVEVKPMVNDQERSFIRFIRDRVLPDRGARAILKRVLRGDPRFTVQAMKFVAPFRPKPGWDEEAFLLTAALFAFHPVHWEEEDGGKLTGNFGTSMGIFASRAYGGGADRRFTRLVDQGLRSSDNVLRRHLFSMVSLIRKERIPVDWGRFLHDLRHWGSPDRTAQRRWARSYFATLGKRLSD